jgi:predicted O-methyltransferase YrrM
VGLKTAIAKARFSAGTYREAVRASRRLGREADATDGSPAALVELAFSFGFGATSAQPVQIRQEIEELVLRLMQLEPRSVLEIGTASGGTLFLLARAASDRATILSLDIQRFDGPRRRFYRSFARRQQHVVPLQADSHVEATVTRVSELLSEQPLDFLFIDGDHAYESVRRDFELYAPLVRPGGLIAIHDIVPGEEELVGGVPRFWEELKGSATDFDEIVADWSQGGWGIGVVRPEALGSVSDAGAHL